MTLNLTVGDKVRVYFYPPSTTSSFVEGFVERTDVRTMDGRCFSLRTTRDVILGRDLPSNRTHPYIALYEAKEDFAGRIEILERNARPEPEAAMEAEPAVELELEQVNEQEAAMTPETRQTNSRIGGWVRLIRRAA